MSKLSLFTVAAPYVCPETVQRQNLVDDGESKFRPLNHI